MKLYDFQQDILDRYHDLIKGKISLKTSHRKDLLVSATGSGKTVMLAAILASLNPNFKVLIIVHKNTLISQTAHKLTQFGIEPGYIKAGYEKSYHKNIYIASIQTLQHRKEWFEFDWDLVVHDEAHETSFSAVGKRLMALPCAHLGLTATPYRLGKRSLQMGDLYNKLIATPVPSELQKMGFLSPMEYWGFKEDLRPDLSDVKVVNGDYSSQDLARVCNIDELIANMCEEYVRLANGKPGLGFCTNVQHAINAAKVFNKMGVKSAYVTGDHTDSERLILYRKLASGSISMLFSCHVLSIGFDLPLVEVGIDMQPTKSRSRHYQKIGRIMRISKETGKTQGLWLDQAGSCSKLGVPEGIKSYQLLHKCDKEPDVAPMKQCPACGLYTYAFTRVCECGYEYPVKEKIALTGKLVKLEDTISKPHKSFQTLMRQAFKRGYMPEWAIRSFYEKNKYYPDQSWYYGAVFAEFDSTNEQAYLMHLNALKQRKNKTDVWVKRWFDAEFTKKLRPTL